MPPPNSGAGVGRLRISPEIRYNYGSMIRPYRQWSLFGAVTLLALVWTNTLAWGTVHKNWSCAAVVQELRRFHSVASLSNSNTDAALSAIRTFRINTLNQPTAHPTWQRRLWVHEHSATVIRRQKVARHLRGIEVSAKNLQDGSIDQRQVVAGTVLKGETAIQEWWQGLAKGAEAIGRLSDSRDMTSWFMRGVGTYMGFNILANVLRPEVPWWWAWPVIFLGFFGNIDSLPRFWWEQDERFDAKQITIKHALADLKEGRNPWFFFSTAYRARLSLIDPLWKSGHVDPQQIRSTDYMRTHSIQTFATAMLVAPLYMRLRGTSFKTAFQNFLGNMHTTRVIWDGLLTRDPESGEPMMVLFVRFTEKRPLYPKPAPKWKEWLRLLGKAEPKPVPLRH